MLLEIKSDGIASSEYNLRNATSEKLDKKTKENIYRLSPNLESNEVGCRIGGIGERVVY
jgi:hypothetical protein